MSNYKRLYDADTFTHNGYTFKVAFERDDDMGEPWKEHDGHGIVSDWTSRAKGPGERVLTEDRGSKRYYDVAASMRLARKDHWGPIHCAICGSDYGAPYDQQYGPHAVDHLFQRESAGKTAARAVDADFEYLRAWCNNEWEWTSVIVTLMEVSHSVRTILEETDITESLCGIDGDHNNYLTEVAYELADQIIHRIEVPNPNIQLSEN